MATLLSVSSCFIGNRPAKSLVVGGEVWTQEELDQFVGNLMHQRSLLAPDIAVLNAQPSIQEIAQETHEKRKRHSR